jgi:GNAT superfamily N-acetyltransferase
MITTSVNNQTLLIRRLTASDLDKLCSYLSGLSQETKKRFGPHSFDRDTLAELFGNPMKYSGFIALQEATLSIIAYSVIKKGFLDHDRPRLESYGLKLDASQDATFAPSVADSWQGQGVGSRLFAFMTSCLQAEQIKRIILWGGVQCDNQKAVSYYRKLGFTVLGQFQYYGQNFDMIKYL